ncbi:MAG: hypothetical protein ACRDUY_00405, partial [Nitriliruptorales bacterium]
GEDWPVTVGAVAPGGVNRVSVAYRPYGTPAWNQVDLEESVDGIWSGAIPDTAIGNNGLEYYVELDVGGTVVQAAGGATMPHVASAPYGDPITAAEAPSAPPGAGQAPLPATGGGIVLAALSLMFGAGLMRRRASA